MTEILFKKITDLDNVRVPQYMTEAASGMDLQAAISVSQPIEPGQRLLIPTGFQMALPQGYEAQIRPRSGLALKHGLTCLNTPGTIDADYRGEVKVLLVNLGQEIFSIQPGERIAQMVIQQVPRLTLKLVDDLPTTERAEAGFGSTGS